MSEITAVPEIIYITKSIWSDPVQHTLVVDCSDPRLPEAREEFLANYCKVHRYDSLCFPGGPVAVTFLNPACFVEHERIRMLHGLHKFQRVIGITHHDCAFYHAKHGKREDHLVQQTTDLNTFKTEIQRIMPGVLVELFHVAPDTHGFAEYKKVG